MGRTTSSQLGFADRWNFVYVPQGEYTTMLFMPVHLLPQELPPIADVSRDSAADSCDNSLHKIQVLRNDSRYEHKDLVQGDLEHGRPKIMPDQPKTPKPHQAICVQSEAHQVSGHHAEVWWTLPIGLRILLVPRECSGMWRHRIPLL